MPHELSEPFRDASGELHCAICLRLSSEHIFWSGNANPHASLDVTPYRETFPITTDRFERWIVTVYRASRSEHRDAHSLAKTWKILHAPNSHRLLTLDEHFHMFVDD